MHTLSGDTRCVSSSGPGNFFDPQQSQSTVIRSMPLESFQARVVFIGKSRTVFPGALLLALPSLPAANRLTASSLSGFDPRSRGSPSRACRTPPPARHGSPPLVTFVTAQNEEIAIICGNGNDKPPENVLELVETIHRSSTRLQSTFAC